jgi:folate-dependent phosphoribosylglycinamide formyltransferase PurN
MNIAIFINEEYAFTFDLLRVLIPKLQKGHKVSGVCCFPDRLTKYTGARIYWEYFKVFGPAVFMKLVLMNLTQRANIAFGWIMGRTPYAAFKGMCRCYGIEKLNFRDPNDHSVIEWVQRSGIDVILLFAGHILKEDIIKSPKVCILNKHAALLPSNKGVFPVFWSMLQGEPVGVTIHKVNEKIDAGEIILQKDYGRRAGFSVYDYYRLIFSDTPDMVLESLKLIQSGSRKNINSNLHESYYGLPARADYLSFRKKGLRFI